MTLVEFNEKVENSGYLELIHRVQSLGRGLTREKDFEIHHIHTRGLAGDVREETNLVKLTLFEHCLAHLLLFKVYPCSETGRPLIVMSGHQFLRLSKKDQKVLEQYGWSESLRAASKIPCSGKTRQKLRVARKGKICITDETRELFILAEDLDKYPGFRRGHTAEHIKKGGLQSRGRKYVNKDGKEKLVRPEQLEFYIKEGYKLGRTAEHNNSMHEKLLGRKSTRVGYKHSDEVRKRMSESHKGTEPANKGRVSIIKDSVKRYVHREELEKYLEAGWVQGSRKLSVESRLKLSRNSKGHKWSAESRLNKSLQCRGRTSNTKGRKRMYLLGERCRMVKPCDIDFMLEQGWSLKKIK